METDDVYVTPFVECARRRTFANMAKRGFENSGIAYNIFTKQPRPYFIEHFETIRMTANAKVPFFSKDRLELWLQSTFMASPASPSEPMAKLFNTHMSGLDLQPKGDEAEPEPRNVGNGKDTDLLKGRKLLIK